MGAFIMSVNTKLVSSDIYDLTEFMKDLKKEFIPLSNDDTLYTSTFGYMGEICAEAMQNAIIAASEYSNEAIPTRAKFDRNVIVHAMTLGIDKVHASPAKMPIVLAIPESCVVQNLGNDKTGTRKDSVFTIDHTIPFMIEGIEFHLDYDINITRYKKDYVPSANSPDNSEVIYTARYDMSVINPTSDIDNEILPTVGVFKYADIFQDALSKADNVLIIYTTLSQVMYDETEIIVSSDNELMNKTISFQFEDQMAYFDVAVYEANSDTPRVLTPIYDGLYKDGVTDYCYYSYMNSNSIRIRFDRDICMPSMNSKVIVRKYTTLGSGGNFKYSENLSVRFPSTNRVDYNSVYALIQQRGEGSSDGLDRATTKQLQEIIPKEMLSRGFITTNTDLQNYFNSLSTENNIVYVYRKEDSLLRRTYYSYSLMKDNDGNILPTNTIPIRVLSVPVNDEFAETVGFLESGTPIYLPYNSSSTQPIAAFPIDVDTASDLPIIGLNANYEGYGVICTDTVAFVTYITQTTPIYVESYPIETGEYIKFRDTYGPILEGMVARSTVSVYRLNAGFLYTNPFSTIITQPLATTGSIRPRCSFIMDEVNASKFTSFEFINDKSSIQFIASNIKISRPSFIDIDRYVYYMDIDFTPNQNMASIEPDHIQTTLVISNLDGVRKGYVTGYHVPELDDISSLHFRYRFETESITTAWNTNNTIKCKDIYSIGQTSKAIDPIKYLPENIKIDIYTMYHYKDGAPCKTIGQCIGGGDKVYGEIALYEPTSFAYPFQVRDTDTVPLPPDPLDPGERLYMKYWTRYYDDDVIYNPHPIYTEYPSYQKFTEHIVNNPDISYTLGDMVLTNKYSVTNNAELFYNYTDHMDSHVSIQQGSDSSIIYTLNRIPCVRYAYMDSDERVEFFLEELRKSMMYVSSSVDKLETLFGIDFKLFNTYGPSKIYQVESTSGDVYQLNQVNLQLHFRAKLYTDSDKSIIEQIKTDIKEYVEDIRNLKDLHMPNLVASILKTYSDYLVFFEYVEIDNDLGSYDATKPHVISTADSEDLREVPEFINISFNPRSGLPDINIDIIV